MVCIPTSPQNTPRGDRPLPSRSVSSSPPVPPTVGPQSLRRPGIPADLDGAVVFLASEASRSITGQTLLVDGGITILPPAATAWLAAGRWRPSRRPAEVGAVD